MEGSQSVVDKCKKVINIIRCLVEVEWGCRYCCFKIYTYIALLRCRLDYVDVAYEFASKTLLARWDGIQAQALRICIGAVRSAPVCMVQVKTGEMPLCLWRKELLASYWLNLKRHGDRHPTKTVLKTCWGKGKIRKVKFWMDRGWSSKKHWSVWQVC